MEEKKECLIREKTLTFIARHGAIIGICCVLIVFQIIEPKFMRLNNILGVLNSSSILIVTCPISRFLITVSKIDNINMIPRTPEIC